MVSISTDRCNTPRPKTWNESALSVGSTRKATFRSHSLRNPVARWWALQYLPPPRSTRRQMLARDVLSLAADERRRVNAEHHLDRRLIDRYARHGPAGLRVANRVAD